MAAPGVSVTLIIPNFTLLYAAAPSVQSTKTALDLFAPMSLLALTAVTAHLGHRLPDLIDNFTIVTTQTKNSALNHKRDIHLITQISRERLKDLLELRCASVPIQLNLENVRKRQ